MITVLEINSALPNASFKACSYEGRMSHTGSFTLAQQLLHCGYLPRTRCRSESSVDSPPWQSTQCLWLAARKGVNLNINK